MVPMIMMALNLARNKAAAQNQFSQNLNTNSLAQQQQQPQPQPQQQNKQNLFSIFSKIYGGFGK